MTVPLNQMNLAGALKKATRGDVFQQLVDTGTISVDGKNWLLAALDPYHDFEHPIAGYPDQTTVKTLVKVVQQTHSLSKPVGLPPNGLWDCHIVTLPFCAAVDGGFDLFPSVLDELNGVVSVGPANFVTNGQFGLVSAIAVPTGSPTLFQDAILRSRDVVGSSPIVPGVQGTGALRLIGAGFEVTNTTAELTRQGTVTCYTYATAPTRDAFVDVALFTEVGDTYVDFINTAADAYRVPGSVQWAAADGVYVPLRLANAVNPVQSPVNLHQNIFQARNGDDSSNQFEQFRLGASRYKFPINCSGAYFTGLSETTTLTLTTRFYVEVQPALSSTLLDLVSPPAQFDPIVLEIYTRVMNMLPPGTRKGDNDAGDWFRNLGRVAGQALSNPMVGSLLSMTPAAGLMPLVSKAGSLLSSIPDQRVFGRPAPKPVRTAQNQVDTVKNKKKKKQ